VLFEIETGWPLQCWLTAPFKSPVRRNHCDFSNITFYHKIFWIVVLLHGHFRKSINIFVIITIITNFHIHKFYRSSMSLFSWKFCSSGDRCLTRCLGQLSFLQDVLDNVYDNCDAGYKYRNCRILKEIDKRHDQLLTQFSVNTPSMGDTNPRKEDHYFELVLSLTTHNIKPICCVCLFLILMHLLLKGSLPLNLRAHPLSYDHPA
jgi:hypothetical protein